MRIYNVINLLLLTNILISGTLNAESINLNNESKKGWLEYIDNLKKAFPVIKSKYDSGKELKSNISDHQVISVLTINLLRFKEDEIKSHACLNHLNYVLINYALWNKNEPDLVNSSNFINYYLLIMSTLETVGECIK